MATLAKISENTRVLENLLERLHVLDQEISSIVTANNGALAFHARSDKWKFVGHAYHASAHYIVDLHRLNDFFSKVDGSTDVNTLKEKLSIVNNRLLELRQLISQEYQPPVNGRYVKSSLSTDSIERVKSSQIALASVFSDVYLRSRIIELRAAIDQLQNISAETINSDIGIGHNNPPDRDMFIDTTEHTNTIEKELNIIEIELNKKDKDLPKLHEAEQKLRLMYVKIAAISTAITAIISTADRFVDAIKWLLPKLEVVIEALSSVLKLFL